MARNRVSARSAAALSSSRALTLGGKEVSQPIGRGTLNATSLRALAVALSALLPAACRRGPPPRITLANVERCELGVDMALTQPTQLEAGSIFHRECSDTFAEPACQKAFLDASNAPLTARTMTALERCSKAYCPLFSGQKLAACDPALVMNPLNAALAWPSFHYAVLQRDASGYAPRLQRTFMNYGLGIASKPEVPP